VEQVNSNWSGGSVGSGCLFKGNVGNNETCGYLGAKPEKGFGRNTKAMLTLSNNQTIWDMVANMYEHVSFAPSGIDATHQELDQPDVTASGWNFKEFTALNNNGANTFISGYTDGKAVFRPSNDSWNSTQGMGQIYTDSNSGASTAHVFMRSGFFSNPAQTGIYILVLLWTPSDLAYDFGFRCAR
ncbi:MAG: hypothetical protein NTY61_00525, partial [Candidatus Parcubacteria bacterium]|nr:hypothetical protein [Candidatus Parcubacteria bacterium]